MKVVTILASPRKGGNTARVLGWMEERIRGLGHEVERFDLVDLALDGCRACYACRKQEKPGACVQDHDDANRVFASMTGGHVVIFASPLYCWSVTAELKALFDRGFCLVRWNETGAQESVMTGKRTALLVTCAGPLEGNADLVVPMYERIADYIDTENVGHLLVPGCTEPDNLDDGVRLQAEDLAQRLVVGV